MPASGGNRDLLGSFFNRAHGHRDRAVEIVMDKTDRTEPAADALGQLGERASSYICTQTVDKLAWRSKITTEQSMAILQAAGMAGPSHDRG